MWIFFFFWTKQYSDKFNSFLYFFLFFGKNGWVDNISTKSEIFKTKESIYTHTKAKKNNIHMMLNFLCFRNSKLIQMNVLILVFRENNEKKQRNDIKIKGKKMKNKTKKWNICKTILSTAQFNFSSFTGSDTVSQLVWHYCKGKRKCYTYTHTIILM